MSYDYDAIVSSIRKLRAEAYGGFDDGGDGPTTEHDGDAAATNEADGTGAVRKAVNKIKVEPLSRAVEEFVKLSGYCPLPPALWIQYANDASMVMDLLLREDDDGAGAGGKDKMDVDGEEGGGDGGVEKNHDGASAQALQVKLDVLETACSTEMWPGCSRLRLEHLRTLLQLHGTSPSSGDGDDMEAEGSAETETTKVVVVDATRVRDAFEDAILWVGMGTHRSDPDVAEMWRMYATWMAADRANAEDGKESATARDVAEIYARRALVPLDSNDSLTEEVRDMESSHPQLGSLMDLPVDGHPSLAEAIEIGRARTSRIFDRYASNEADVRSNMHAEGILLERSNHGVENERYLMGLGGMGTASAFVAYAKASSTRSAIRSIGYDMSGRMYERAVSECPTVEDLWIPFVNSLLRNRDSSSLPSDDNNKEEEDATANSNGEVASSPTMTATSVAERACKNCPYSSRLHALRMRCVASANVASKSFDGDALIGLAKDAVDAGFLPTAEARLEVYLEACRVIRRHLMNTVCGEYDEPLPTTSQPAKSATGKSGDGGVGHDEDGEEEPLELDGEEVGFIVEDLRDAYDAAEEYVRSAYPKWGEGARLVWHDRALAEARVIGPALALIAAAADASSSSSPTTGANGEHAEKVNGGGDDDDEVTRYFEKSVKTYPNVATSWIEYASFLVSAAGPTTPPPTQRRRRRDMAYRGLRRARDVYRRGVGATSVNDERLATLCDEFVSFERSYGSYDSLAKATGMTKAKMRRHRQRRQQAAADEPSTTVEVEVERRGGTKRKAEGNDVGPDAEDGELDGGDQKRAKVDHHGDADGTTGGTASGSEAGEDEKKKKKPTNLKVEDDDRRHRHVVRIGRMEYPAHPYTVRVSNLSPSTQDMDLVDAFSRCGRIVHARILREKHCGPGYKGGGGADGDEGGGGVVVVDHHNVKRGKSKGVGLVQFEERESVEDALRLNEEVGIDERLVRVERSNIPASFIVPPGMHRVNPKGKGKHTKKNVKIKATQQQQQHKKQPAETKDATSSTAEGEATGKSSVAGDETTDVAKSKRSEPEDDGGGAPRADVLAFRPRGLAHPRRRLKVEVARRNTSEKAPDGTSKPG